MPSRADIRAEIKRLQEALEHVDNGDAAPLHALDRYKRACAAVHEAEELLRAAEKEQREAMVALREWNGVEVDE